MNWKKRLFGGLAVVALLGGVLAGCSGDNADEEAIEAALLGIADASTKGDAAAYAAYFTDEGLMDDLGMTRDELLAASPDDWADPIRVETIKGIEIDGDTARADVTFVVYESFIARIAPKLVKIDGEWKFNEGPGNEFLLTEIPSDVTPVGITMSDFAFGFDAAAPAAGTRAFTFTNKAAQDHEAVLFRVTDPELDVMEALGSEGEPEGIEFQGFAMAKAGETANMLFVNSLAAGRYAMICFLPDVNDAAETPHAFKGMVTEFAIP